jgi:hypothetical protein
MNASDFKTVISLLDVNMGTNHFGNLLSTSDLITPRVSVIDYHDYLINEYAKKTDNAHIASIVGFTTLNNVKHQDIIKTSTKPYVLAGHLMGFWGSKDVITSFGNFLVFLGQSTELNNILAKRTHNIDRFLTMYNPSFLVKNVGVAENNIITFDPNLLFSSNITQLIEVLNAKSNLNLDIKFCQELHDIWWDKIILKSLV